MLNRTLAFTLALLSTAALTHPAPAQKPVLVQNADDPGRTSYQETVYLDQGITCLNRFCEAKLPAVPAGSRLVITQVSLRFFAGDTSTYAYISVNSNPSFSLPDPQITRVYLPATAIAGGLYLATSPVSLYVPPTIAPTMDIFTNGLLNQPNMFLAATVVGYLVPLP